MPRRGLRDHRERTGPRPRSCRAGADTL